MNDKFRKEYKDLDEFQKDQINQIKFYAATIDNILSQFPSGSVDTRCLALAGTKLEECVMWAVKGITK